MATASTDWRAHVDRALAAAEGSLGLSNNGSASQQMNGSPRSAGNAVHGREGLSHSPGAQHTTISPSTAGIAKSRRSAFGADGGHARYGTLKQGSPSPAPAQAAEPVRHELSALISSAQGTLAELRAESRAAAGATGEPRISAEEVRRSLERAEHASLSVQRIEDEVGAMEQRLKRSTRRAARSRTKRMLHEHAADERKLMQRMIDSAKGSIIEHADNARQQDRRVSDNKHSQTAAYACLALAQAEASKRQVSSSANDIKAQLREHVNRVDRSLDSITSTRDEMQSELRALQTSFDNHRTTVREELGNVHASFDNKADEAIKHARERLATDISPLRERLSEAEKQESTLSQRIDQVVRDTESTASKLHQMESTLQSMREPRDVEQHLNKHLESLSRRVDEIDGRVAEEKYNYQQQHATLTQSYEDLKAEIAALKEDNERKEQKIGTLSNRIASLEQLSSAKQNTQGQSESSNKEIQEPLDQLTSRIRQLEAQISQELRQPQEAVHADIEGSKSTAERALNRVEAVENNLSYWQRFEQEGRASLEREMRAALHEHDTKIQQLMNGSESSQNVPDVVKEKLRHEHLSRQQEDERMAESLRTLMAKVRELSERLIVLEDSEGPQAGVSETSLHRPGQQPEPVDPSRSYGIAGDAGDQGAGIHPIGSSQLAAQVDVCSTHSNVRCESVDTEAQASRGHSEVGQHFAAENEQRASNVELDGIAVTESANHQGIEQSDNDSEATDELLDVYTSAGAFGTSHSVHGASEKQQDLHGLRTSKSSTYAVWSDGYTHSSPAEANASDTHQSGVGERDAVEQTSENAMRRGPFEASVEKNVAVHGEEGKEDLSMWTRLVEDNDFRSLTAAKDVPSFYASTQDMNQALEREVHPVGHGQVADDNGGLQRNSSEEKHNGAVSCVEDAERSVGDLLEVPTHTRVTENPKPNDDRGDEESVEESNESELNVEDLEEDSCNDTVTMTTATERLQDSRREAPSKEVERNAQWMDECAAFESVQSSTAMEHTYSHGHDVCSQSYPGSLQDSGDRSKATLSKDQEENEEKATDRRSFKAKAIKVSSVEEPLEATKEENDSDNTESSYRMKEEAHLSAGSHSRRAINESWDPSAAEDGRNDLSGADQAHAQPVPYESENEEEEEEDELGEELVGDRTGKVQMPEPTDEPHLENERVTTYVGEAQLVTETTPSESDNETELEELNDLLPESGAKDGGTSSISVAPPAADTQAFYGSHEAKKTEGIVSQNIFGSSAEGKTVGDAQKPSEASQHEENKVLPVSYENDEAEQELEGNNLPQENYPNRSPASASVNDSVTMGASAQYEQSSYEQRELQDAATSSTGQTSYTVGQHEQGLRETIAPQRRVTTSRGDAGNTDVSMQPISSDPLKHGEEGMPPQTYDESDEESEEDISTDSDAEESDENETTFDVRTADATSMQRTSALSENGTEDGVSATRRTETSSEVAGVPLQTSSAARTHDERDVSSISPNEGGEVTLDVEDLDEECVESDNEEGDGEEDDGESSDEKEEAEESSNDHESGSEQAKISGGSHPASTGMPGTPGGRAVLEGFGREHGAMSPAVEMRPSEPSNDSQANSETDRASNTHGGSLATAPADIDFDDDDDSEESLPTTSQ